MAGENISGFKSNIGLFKDAWDGQVIKTYEGDVPLVSGAQFDDVLNVGGIFHRPTQLTVAGGTTFAAASTSSTSTIPGQGSNVYVGPRPAAVLDAQITGMQIHGRGQTSYESIARSMDSVDANSPDAHKAVRAATSTDLASLMLGTLKKTEALFLHGGMGLGTIEANSEVVATTYESVSGYAIDVRISAATWSEGIWLANEGSPFDFFAPTSGLPAGTKLNTTANTHLSGTNETGAILIAIEPSTLLTGLTGTTSRVLRFWHTSGTAGGTGVGIIGAMTYVQASTAIACFEGAGPSNECTGLNLIAANTGTLWNISAASYSMWKGNSVDMNGAPIKLADIVRYSSKPINAGAKGKRMVAVVPTECFAQFANDESVLRRYQGSIKEGNSGFNTLELYLPMKGVLEVLGHNQQKDGYVTIFPQEELHRIGSQDIDIVSRSGKKENLIMEVANSPASELRLFGMMAPAIDTPKHCVRMSNFAF